MEKEYPHEVQLTLFDHLKELRGRLFCVVACMVVMFIVGICLDDFLFNLVMTAIPDGVKKIITDPFAGFFLQMKIATYFAVYCSLPVMSYQLYGFIRPALSGKEDRTVRIFFGISFALLTMALVFAYQVLPFLMDSMIGFKPPATETMADVEKWISKLLACYLGFSIIFQLPLIILVSIAMGFVEARFYTGNRRWVVIILLVLSAIFSPPDVVSQVIIFIPLYALFEVAVLVGEFWRKRRCSV